MAGKTGTPSHFDNDTLHSNLLLSIELLLKKKKTTHHSISILKDDAVDITDVFP